MTCSELLLSLQSSARSLPEESWMVLVRESMKNGNDFGLFVDLALRYAVAAYRQVPSGLVSSITTDIFSFLSISLLILDFTNACLANHTPSTLLNTQSPRRGLQVGRALFSRQQSSPARHIPVLERMHKQQLLRRD